MSLPIVTIIGNLTADPELRTTNSGKQVVNFSVAANQRRLNQQTNQWEDGDSLFMNCTAWDQQNRTLASNIASSLRKGMTVIVQGRLSQRKYQAKDGAERTVVEMTVDNIGADLNRATVQVNRQQSQSQQGGFNGAPQQFNQPQQGGFNPQQPPAQQQPYQTPQGGFTPGMNLAQQPPQQQPADPWSSNGGFGGTTEF